ncbi:MAG: hypothetical protein ACI906_004633 [Candidatus Latescibacterota bacterium]|jgi:hypothetical protein
MITTEFERELINGLSELFPNHNEYSIENIEEIVGGQTPISGDLTLYVMIRK